MPIVMPRLALLAALALAGCAHVVPPTPSRPTACMSPEALAQCASEGGCRLWTRRAIDALMEEVAVDAHQAGVQACRSRT